MKQKIGQQVVSNINQVQNDLHVSKVRPLKDGFSFLLRVKNEITTIKKCVEEIIPFADEIIIVDNLSTDGTKDVLRQLEENYHQIFVYEYEIQIPRAGQEHIDHVLLGRSQKFNTLTNYYNWCLSKATYKKIIKWDADFYCIQSNLKELLDFLRPKMNDNFAAFFSGITCFVHHNKTYLKKINCYNEYRVFSYDHGFQWYDSVSHDEVICETSWPGVSRLSLNDLHLYAKPVFLEIKSTEKDEFSGRSSLFDDNRDKIDYQILEYLTQNVDDERIYEVSNCEHEYEHFNLYQDDVRLPKFISENRNLLLPEPLFLENRVQISSNKIFLINIATTGIGGVETLSSGLFQYFNSFINVKYLTLGPTSLPSSIDYDTFISEVKNYKQKVYVLCVTDLFSTEMLAQLTSQYGVTFFGMVHSDVAYYNSYFNRNAAYFSRIIVVNKQTYHKYQANNISNLILIRNNIVYENIPLEQSEGPKFKLLFFSRVSPEKNLMMLLYSLKHLSEKIPKITLDVYSEHDDQLTKYIQLLQLNDVVQILTPIHDKSKSNIYRQYDACILPSVSEGTSLNILECINAEIPILCSKIKPNIEIINYLLPMFDFNTLDDIASRYDYVYHYNEFLESIGYVIHDDGIDAPYFYYDCAKMEIFEKNVMEIARVIIEMYNHYDACKKNTKLLKQLIKNRYFDINHYYLQFAKLISDSA